jgi:hypothetical protein
MNGKVKIITLPTTPVEIKNAVRGNVVVVVVIDSIVNEGETGSLIISGSCCLLMTLGDVDRI